MVLIDYCLIEIEKKKDAELSCLTRRLRESPEEYFKCYPNLSWALAYRIVYPNKFAVCLGSQKKVELEIPPAIKCSVDRFLCEILVPEYQLAEVIEGLSQNPLIKVNAPYSFRSFATEIGLPGSDYAFNSNPIQGLDPNALTYVLWMIACSARTAFAHALQQAIDLRMFQMYPNLSLALHLAHCYGIDKGLVNVLAYNDRPENVFRDAVPGKTVPCFGQAEYFGVLVAIVSEFYRFSGLSMESLDFSEHMRRVVGGSERFDLYFRFLV